MKTVGQYGEFNLIERFKAQLPKSSEGALGIGDDCAALPIGNGKVQLATTDMLIDGVHFLQAHIPAAALGRKALTVNLSDIAAMGGQPLYALLSLALPPDTGAAWLDEFMAGLSPLSAESHCPIIGGDTTRSDTLSISITVIGEAAQDKIKLRSSALAGDIICVTDYLGTSKAGLDCILNNRQTSQLVKDLIAAHYYPRAHLPEGAWLANQSAVHAMMDLSDGLAGDIKHIMQQSKCGAIIELNDLPKAQNLLAYAAQYNLDANEYAFAGGEDYCLLLTIAADEFDAIARDYRNQFNTPLYAIGRILPVDQGLKLTCHGAPTILNSPENMKGFDHFK